MTSGQSFKYDVAFSFLHSDEAIAYSLNDLIQDRLSTFIYSQKQNELAATDGEKNFSKVFQDEARIVVILYRDGWGTTAWTRIEETAIKNRAFGKGWDFLLLINLDPTSTMPLWIPKSYIWVDFPRLKQQGAIGVIEHKVKETGGQIRPETIQDRADRLKRRRTAENERESFLRSNEAVSIANEEVKLLIEKFKKTQPTIEDHRTFLYLETSSRPSPPMFEFGFENYFLCFNCGFDFRISSRNPIVDGALYIFLYEKGGYPKEMYPDKIIKQTKLRFDRDLYGNNGWSDYETRTNFITSDELLEQWVKEFIDNIELRRKI